MSLKIALKLDAVLTSLPVMRRQLNGLHLNVFADCLADIPAKTKISTANMSTEWKVERQGPFVVRYKSFASAAYVK